MIGCIPVDTIQSILDDTERAPNLEQAFTEAFPAGQGPTPAEVKEHFVARFRYRMIASLSFDRWLRALRDRFTLVRDEALVQWEILQANKDSFTELNSSQTDYTDTYSREEMPFSIPAGGPQYLKSRDTHDMHAKGYTDLNTSTAKQAMQDVPDFWEMYLDRFEDCFLRRI